VRSRAAVVVALALVVGAAGCGRGTHRPALPQSASPSHGRQLIEYYGCGACHVIGGIATANGHVGPPLTDFGSNHQIAGTLPNTPANVVRWIMNPQGILPKTDMPNLGIGRSGAQSIAAYLYGQ
jgi:cytochrome c